ncbi:MAG: PfkB family carbohydrate kinase [Caldilineaceae bacterium]|nr:PfkB family carbohydrate kinase [Caldilineaceae bacterium]
MSIDLLAIGTVTRDIETADPASVDYVLGGTVSFAAVTAARLGYRPAILTRAGDDVDLTVLHEIASVHVLPSERTTTFANLYSPAGRVQYCYTPSPPIGARDIPPQLRAPRIALLGPLANEVLPDVAAAFATETLVAAVPQGWMRRWDSDGRVFPIAWTTMTDILPLLDVLILSIEDIDGELQLLREFLKYTSLVILTEYRDGSTVYRRAGDEVETIPVPPRPADELDPTGAGDIFATAFLLRLAATGDPLDAARYANVTASFGVEARGVAGIPTHAEVLAYMAEHPWQACGSAST